MSKDAKFLRLLGDYEVLTRDETFALTESKPNFPVIAAIHEKKAVIFAELEKEGKLLGIQRRKNPANAALMERFAALIEMGKANADYAAAEMTRIRLELEEIQVVSLRIQSLNRTYLGSVFETPVSRFNTVV